MKGQAVNPYLPENEYLPDGEPHVFGDRVYVYGSHDRFNAPIFCMNDYVCYSAPVDDLSDWRYEGVIYRKKQDPMNRSGLRLLFAPDVARGADGKYYLYYAFDLAGVMGVAVCDTPAGQFRYLGNVRHPDKTMLGRKTGDPFAFDPGILVDDDGRIFLYFGYYRRMPAIVTGGKRLSYEGGYVAELERDMLTLKGEPKLFFPKQGQGSFAGHEFFEASSIRKIRGKYYFVYSPRKNHDLCYAVSDRPTEGFTFQGTLISNGDIGIGGYREEGHAANYTGNNHGGILCLGEKYYIFYHRQTNRHSYSRQACAERIFMREDNTFAQAEMTSCGLNGDPLEGKGTYGAYIACNLSSGQGTGRYDIPLAKYRYRNHPCLTQDRKDGDPKARQYIANLRDGAWAGFKYFALGDVSRIAVKVRGRAKGQMIVSTDVSGNQVIARIAVEPDGKRKRAWRTLEGKVSIKEAPEKEPAALYFLYQGRGSLDFLSFTLL